MTIQITNTPTATDNLPTILYNNLFAQGTLSVTNSGTSYLNAVTENTYKYWTPSSLPSILTVDLGSAYSADAFAVVGHDCYTHGNTLTLQSSPDNTTWTTRCTVTPTDNTTILGLFNSVSARYWRLQVSGGTVPNIAVVMLGARFTFPAGVKPPYVPVWLSQQYELLTATTIGGQFLGNRVKRKGGKTQINLVALDRSFVESSLLGFKEHYNLGKAFVWAAGPNIFTKDVGYVWRTEGSTINPVFDSNGLFMSTSMEVYAYGE